MEIEHCLKLNRKKPYKFWTLFCPIRQIWTQSLSILDGDFFNLTRYLIWLPLKRIYCFANYHQFEKWKRRTRFLFDQNKFFFSLCHMKKIFDEKNQKFGNQDWWNYLMKSLLYISDEYLLIQFRSQVLAYLSSNACILQKASFKLEKEKTYIKEIIPYIFIFCPKYCLRILSNC